MSENKEPVKYDAEKWTVPAAIREMESLDFGPLQTNPAWLWLKKNLLHQPGAKLRSTPGPWRPAKGFYGNNSYSAVVADVLPVGALSGSDDIDGYGGFLIAESIAKCNIPLIVATPMLRDIVAAFRSSSFDQHVTEIMFRYGIQPRGGSVTEILNFLADEALRLAGEADKRP